MFMWALAPIAALHQLEPSMATQKQAERTAALRLEDHSTTKFNKPDASLVLQTAKQLPLLNINERDQRTSELPHTLPAFAFGIARKTETHVKLSPARQSVRKVLPSQKCPH